MKRFLKYYVFLVFAICMQIDARAQSGVYDTLKVEAFITPEGDTIPQSWLPTVEVYAKQSRALAKYWRDWTRLRNAVYVTYPYAITAGRVINQVNYQLMLEKDASKRKQIIKSHEKELKRDFADKVTNLSVYQGRVLMKLINRETGNNCYELIKEYKGSFNAGFWQAVAFVFGSNLKQDYAPKGDDQEIEKIVQEVRRVYGYKG